jgi:hypothetical protein
MIDREYKDKLLALRSMVEKELKRHPLSLDLNRLKDRINDILDGRYNPKNAEVTLSDLRYIYADWCSGMAEHYATRAEFVFPRTKHIC